MMSADEFPFQSLDNDDWYDVLQSVSHSTPNHDNTDYDIAVAENINSNANDFVYRPAAQRVLFKPSWYQYLTTGACVE